MLTRRIKLLLLLTSLLSLQILGIQRVDGQVAPEQTPAEANETESSKTVEPDATVEIPGEKADDGDVDSKQDDNAKDADQPKANPDEPVVGLTFANPITTRWRLNAIIRGGSGPANSMLVTMPIPTNWPEQSVAIVEEDIPANIAKVTYRDLESGVRQIVAAVPQIRAREEIKISVTVEVLTSQIIAAPQPSEFIRPKTNHREGRKYLGVGPQINYRNGKLKKEVKSITKDKSQVWDEVEAIYDWVRDNIEDTSTQPQDVLNAFQDRKGCSEDKVGLFIAMCRAHKIPARMVWVQGAQYAEFMLIDAKQNAHWFPCDVGGIREFGSTSEPRIILQKGDSIRVPEKKSRQKLVAEFATCQGKSKPSVRFHREILSSDD